VNTRVATLDAEHDSAMAQHACEWADRAFRANRVDWTRWRTGAQACYQYAGVRWPVAELRVASPLALARVLLQIRVQEVPGDEDRALVGLVRRLTQARVDGVVPRLFDRRVMARVQRVVHDAVATAVPDAAVAQAVDETLYTVAPVDDPLGVQDSVRQAVRGYTGIRRPPFTSRPAPPTWRSWTLHLGGHWEAAWSAYATFLRTAYGGVGTHSWRRRIATFADAQSAGWWWPHLDFVVVSDRPEVVRTERIGGTPARLHSADGPAVVWRDGWRLHFWHGTRVPAWVIERPTVRAIHAEPNAEVRRCGIEALGWDAYIAEAGLRLVDTAADPGNPGCELRLYDLPKAVLGTPSRVLQATNGSPERDGTRRRYGLPVPADMDTATHAAAWTYGLTGDQYARLARRT
jgi:hypothetical protein